NADQQRKHRLRHRERRQAILVGAAILVALDQNGVVFRDQQAGDRLLIEIVVERLVEAGEVIANDGFARRARQRGRLFRGGNGARRKQRVEAAQRADAAARLVDKFNSLAARIAFLLAPHLGIRSVGTKARAGGG